MRKFIITGMLAILFLVVFAIPAWAQSPSVQVGFDCESSIISNPQNIYPLEVSAFIAIDCIVIDPQHITKGLDYKINTFYFNRRPNDSVAFTRKGRAYSMPVFKKLKHDNNLLPNYYHTIVYLRRKASVAKKAWEWQSVGQFSVRLRFNNGVRPVSTTFDLGVSDISELRMK